MGGGEQGGGRAWVDQGMCVARRKGMLGQTKW